MDRNTLHKQGCIIQHSVALRKESVDRNAEDWLNAGALSRSLSARRAWIEIDAKADSPTEWTGRSPQGERG